MMIIYQDYLIVFEKQSHWCSSWDCQIILGLNVPGDLCMPVWLIVYFKLALVFRKVHFWHQTLILLLRFAAKAMPHCPFAL